MTTRRAVSDWEAHIEAVLDACVQALALAGRPLRRESFAVEDHAAPHRPVTLPPGRVAVYGFWWNGTWLKIGKNGGNSGPRFLSHQYHLTARSSLAKDSVMCGLPGFDPANPARGSGIPRSGSTS